jgi:uroporphyrinogen decarboxylase
MDSRERVLAAIAHEKPDRVPCDLWAEPAVWERLRRDLGVVTDEEVRRILAIDVRYIAPEYPPDRIVGGVRENMWGERWAETQTVYGREWEHTRGALWDAKTLTDLEAFSWPTCDQVDYSGLRQEVERCEGHGIFYGNADFFERPGLVRGLENLFVDVLINPEMVDFLQERFLSFFIEDFYRSMEAAAGRIDVFWALTDLGTQDRLIMGREAMGRWIFRPLRRLADIVHREGVKLMFHSCGAVRETVPQLIAAGVDILNPLQPAAPGHGARRPQAGLRQKTGLSRRHRHSVPSPPGFGGSRGSGDGPGRVYPRRGGRVYPLALPQHPAGHADSQHSGDVPHGRPLGLGRRRGGGRTCRGRCRS